MDVLLYANMLLQKKNLTLHQLSRSVRKPAFCICENKDADQIRGNREADQLLCFRYIAITIPLLPKYEISSLWPSSVTAQPGLCQTWSETPKTGFLITRLNSPVIDMFNKHCNNFNSSSFLIFMLSFPNSCILR